MNFCVYCLVCAYNAIPCFYVLDKLVYIYCTVLYIITPSVNHTSSISQYGEVFSRDKRSKHFMGDLTSATIYGKHSVNL